MTETKQIHRCNVCGNIVEVLHPGAGKLVCCRQPMELLTERAGGKGWERHVPVMERTDVGIKVKVGSIPHVMEGKHHIEWIEVIADGETYRRALKPGNRPEAEFKIEAGRIVAREYCKLHGLWKSS